MPSLAGVRVLLVEDHHDTRDMYSEALTFQGADVIAVQSALDAAPLLASADIVVTDIVMPGEDGVWLWEQTQERRLRIPIVAVSGLAPGQSARLAKATFACVLLKPVDPWDLCEAVVTVLERWRANLIGGDDTAR